MRDAFARTLVELARNDPRVFLVIADLGFRVLDDFVAEFPRRFLNVGVAEQNMTGVAAGLALEGRIVYTYSIGNFPTFRCLEQIRNDVCYHHLDVKIVSIGGGFCYGPLGLSHHATEDLAVMRALPDMRVMAPADPIETRLVTQASWSTPGPFYLRLGRGGEPVAHVRTPDFQLGKCIQVSEGGEIALLSTGGILPNVIQGVELLRQEGIQTSVFSFPTVSPLDADAVRSLGQSMRLIVTVEEHAASGGLGSAVAETLAELESPRACLTRIGLPSRFCSEVGPQEHLRAIHGLSPEGIAQTVKKLAAQKLRK